MISLEGKHNERTMDYVVKMTFNDTEYYLISSISKITLDFSALEATKTLTQIHKEGKAYPVNRYKDPTYIKCLLTFDIAHGLPSGGLDLAAVSLRILGLYERKTEL